MTADPVTLAREVEEGADSRWERAEKQHAEQIERLADEGAADDALPDFDEAKAWEDARSRAVRAVADRHELTPRTVIAAIKRHEDENAERELAQVEGREVVDVASLPEGGTPFALAGDDAPAADWLIPPTDGLPGMLARKFVVGHSGDTGAAKSISRVAMMIAGLHGERFMGREVGARRFMILNGENPNAIERERWAAFGFRDADWSSVHYTDRELTAKLRANPDDWIAYVRREARKFEPDVIDIDTVARATPVPLLDNDAVNELYAAVLVSLADELNCAVIFRAHESQEGAARRSGDRASAVLGARAWIDQADGLVTYVERERARPIEDGTTRSAFDLRVEKMRGQEPRGDAEPFVVVGRREDNILRSLSLDAVDRDGLDIDRMVDAAPGSAAELAAAAGLSPGGTRFRALRQRALKDGRLIERPDESDGRRKVYESA